MFLQEADWRKEQLKLGPYQSTQDYEQRKIWISGTLGPSTEQVKEQESGVVLWSVYHPQVICKLVTYFLTILLIVE